MQNYSLRDLHTPAPKKHGGVAWRPGPAGLFHLPFLYRPRSQSSSVFAASASHPCPPVKGLHASMARDSPPPPILTPCLPSHPSLPFCPLHSLPLVAPYIYPIFTQVPRLSLYSLRPPFQPSPALLRVHPRFPSSQLLSSTFILVGQFFALNQPLHAIFAPFPAISPFLRLRHLLLEGCSLASSTY